MGFIRLRAYLKALEVVERFQRVFRVRHVTRAKLHPGERREAFCRKLCLDDTSHRAVDRPHGMTIILKEERKAYRLDLRDQSGNEGNPDPSCEDAVYADPIDEVLGAAKSHIGNDFNV